MHHKHTKHEVNAVLILKLTLMYAPRTAHTYKQTHTRNPTALLNSRKAGRWSSSCCEGPIWEQVSQHVDCHRSQRWVRRQQELGPKGTKTTLILPPCYPMLCSSSGAVWRFISSHTTIMSRDDGMPGVVKDCVQSLSRVTVLSVKSLVTAQGS